MGERLYRSRTDRVIGGVAGGVAVALDVDPSIVRVVWVVLAFLTGGLAAIVYVVMLVVVPEAPGELDWEPRSTPTAPDASQAVDSAWPSPEAAPIAGAPTSTSAPRPRPRRERGTSGSDAGGAGLVFGVILILVGAYFLVREYVPQIDLDLAWPVVVIALGILLIVGAVRPGRSRGR